MNTLCQMEAEIIFGDQPSANAAAIELIENDYAVEHLDWFDGVTPSAWLMARAIAANDDTFHSALKAIVEPFGGMVWCAGPGWTDGADITIGADAEVH